MEGLYFIANMKFLRNILGLVLLAGSITVSAQSAFVKQQLQYPRVKSAKKNTDAHMRLLFEKGRGYLSFQGVYPGV